MTADHWLALAALLLLVVIGLLIRHADFFVATDPDDDADHRMDSQRLGLPEPKKEARRVRAGS